MGMRFIFIPLSPFGKAEKLQKRRKGQKWQASGNPERGRTLGPHLRSAHPPVVLGSAPRFGHSACSPTQTGTKH